MCWATQFFVFPYLTYVTLKQYDFDLNKFLSTTLDECNKACGGKYSCGYGGYCNPDPNGKFPNYVQVIPKENQKKLEVDLKSFLNSVDRVASVSLDKKDGVKFSLSKDILNLSVNNTNSGDGKESLSVKFDDELDISFNSRYLIDVASQLDGEKIEIYLKDSGLPALIKDPADFDSIYVVMPMKG